jgi:hypothetical protein
MLLRSYCVKSVKHNTFLFIYFKFIVFRKFGLKVQYQALAITQVLRLLPAMLDEIC